MTMVWFNYGMVFPSHLVWYSHSIWYDIPIPCWYEVSCHMVLYSITDTMTHYMNMAQHWYSKAGTFNSIWGCLKWTN